MVAMVRVGGREKEDAVVVAVVAFGATLTAAGPTGRREQNELCVCVCVSVCLMDSDGGRRLAMMAAWAAIRD
jgi:hypothetical protein